MKDKNRKLFYAILGILPVAVAALLMFQKCSSCEEEGIPEITDAVDTLAVESADSALTFLHSQDTADVAEVIDDVIPVPSPAVLSPQPVKQKEVLAQETEISPVEVEAAPVVDSESSEVTETEVEQVVEVAEVPESAEDTVVAVVESIPEPEMEDPDLQLSLKSNLLGWAMGVSNFAVEIDMAEHWSFHLPLYYSAWNYFKPTTKFRILATQPEIRYWFSENNENFFLGAHFGMAYFNVAAGGAYRYQDHYKKTPALGGGLTVGYRMPVRKNSNWKVEFSLGAGGYSVHYDRFHNTPDATKGLMVDNIKTTYWGIDNVSISFLYSFDLKRKGGRK